MQQKLSTERSRPGLEYGGPVVRALVGALLLYSSICPAIAQPPKPTEYDVKAAYLLNFGKFIRHPRLQTPHSSFDICILGRDPMGRTLDEIAANESINGLPVHIRRLQDVTDAKSCEIVFVSSFEGERIREDMAILAATDVLTVSDDSDFIERGGMIQFVLVSNHVRFAVNLTALNRAHLVLSSELLRVASSVTGKPPTGEMP
jgi:hypothetical protein